MTNFERPKSLTELVASTIRERIVEGRILLGGALSEGVFAKEFGVSRTPVREAFNRLETEGLVRTMPQRGTFGFTMSPDDLAKICDARVCLEMTALRLAYQHDADALHSALTGTTSAIAVARERNNDPDFLREDTRYHQSLFDCADNRFLNEAYQAISAKIAALRNRMGMHPDHMAKSHAEHIEIARAIADRDLARAEAILLRHVDRRKGSYWQDAIEKGEPVD